MALITKNRFYATLSFGLVVVFSLILVYKYISQEQFVYFMDYATYFDKYRYFPVFTNFSDFINEMIRSVQQDEYGWLPVVPLLLLKPLLGISRFGYEAAVVIVYAIPSLYFLVYLIKLQFKKYIAQGKNPPPIFWMVVLATPPLFWAPLLWGYLDVLVMLPSVALLGLGFFVLNGKASYRLFAVMGVLVFLAPVLRRWELIWVVSYLVCLYITVIFQSVSNKANIASLAKICLGFVASLLVVSTLALLVRPYFLSQISGSFILSLDAYFGRTTLWNKVVVYMQVVGGVYLLPFLFGIYHGLKNKDSRYFSAFLIGSMITAFLGFSFFQDLNDHHSYLYLPQLIFFSAYGLLVAWKRNTVFIAVFAIFVLLSYQNVFSFKPKFNSNGVVLPKMHYPPNVRNDLDNLDKIIGDLEHLINEDEGNIYILSSSVVLNETTIRARAYETYHYDLVNHIEITKDVDKRDGFPWQFFRSKYVVLSVPPGYHLDPWEQRSIGLIQEFVHNGGDHKQIGECYQLDGNICAYVYKRVNNYPIDTSLLESRFTHGW